MRQLSPSPPHGMPYAMPLAQKPPYAGMYFMGSFSNRALCCSSGVPVLWVCDPMHGNTETTASGVKTRRFENILAELEAAFKVHRSMGSYLGGVHFELTGEDVTECTGGARGLADADLAKDYRSQVDPRLNYGQALELAMRIATVARSA